MIFYRKNDSGLEFLLGKRKAKEVEGGKWALIGGTGAFWEGAENIFDFAQREAFYDLFVSVNLGKLNYFIDRVKRKGMRLILELYFSYRLEANEEVEVTGNKKAPDECRWFSRRELKEAEKGGEIAFDNYQTLKLFEKQIL